MKRKLAVMFAAAVLVSWLMPPCVFSETITIATLNWEPYVGEKLIENGFAAEIVREALLRKGYEAKFVFLPWKRALHETLLGKYDAAFPTYHSEKRAGKYIYSKPFADSVVGFYVHRDSNIAFNKLDDLIKYRIGIVLGYINPPDIDDADYLQKELVISDYLNVKKLLAKRIDLAVMDKHVGRLIINKLQGAGEELVFLEPPLETKPLYVAFSLKSADSGKRAMDFNEGLRLITDDGTLAKILNKHGIEH